MNNEINNTSSNSSHSPSLKPGNSSNNEEKKKRRREGNTQKENKKRREDKTKKYALLISYTGSNFSGLQIQSNVLTIEGVIIEALKNLNVIETTNAKALDLTRACRTDRGVHAVRNILCCRMKQYVLAEYESVDAFCDRLNQEIKELCGKYPQKGKKPGEEIVRNVLVHSYTIVHDYFIPKNFCKRRTYLYLLPKRVLFANSALNALVHGSDPSKMVANQSDEMLIQRLNDLFRYYEGRHSFHNFTEGENANHVGNPSNYRHMFSVQLDPNTPMIKVEGQDYFLVRFDGQSFMLHQIRRMVGLVVIVMLGLLEESIIPKSLSLQYRTIVPQAPGVNLMLEKMDFATYDNKSRQCYEKVGEWSQEIEAKCEAFKQTIYKEIVRADSELRETADFIFTITYEHKKFGQLVETGKIDPPPGQKALKRQQKQAQESVTEKE
jgi:tRNA pseudouridine38-40 synthase